MTKHSYTEVVEGVIVCNDCGEFAETKELVVHNRTCRVGSSQREIDLYSEFELEPLVTDEEYEEYEEYLNLGQTP